MDNFIVSARKYRPATFETVVGQHSITSTLQNAIRNNTLAQAFLFCGPRGVGKTTCARIMAKTINCMHPTDDMEACNECESCVSFNNSNSFNIYELDAASNNSVEDIRNLTEQIRIPPQVGKYKIYIIDEVHMLSSAAFNAFLKTLEEPPAYAKFIFATTEKHKIPATILSRCQIFDFKRITVADIVEHLKKIAEKEGVTAEEEALEVIAEKADGALRDSLSIFDQMISFSGKNLTYQNVIENLNVLDSNYYFTTVDYFINADCNGVLRMIDDIANKGFDIQHFLQGLASHIRKVLLAQDTATADILECSTQQKLRFTEQAQHVNPDFMLQALTLLDQYDNSYRTSSNKRLHVEICLLRLCKMNPQLQTTSPIQPAIQPITPKPQPQPQSQPQPQPQPQPQSQSQSQSQPQPQSQPSEVISQKPTERLHRSATMSVSDMVKKDDKPVEEVKLENRFTEAQLQAAWKLFVETDNNVSRAFIAGISAHQPTLVEPFEINIEVDNGLVMQNVEDMEKLRNYLRKSLNNNIFTIVDHISEHPAELKPYTDKDCFEEMAKKNPSINVIKDELKLGFEM